MGPAPRPVLDPEIVVATDLPIESLWDRFEVFEALHHSQTICNPMQSAELDHVIALLDPAGKSMLDVACGSGELLLRSHEAGVARSTGLDLSPWMLQAAARRGRRRLAAGPRPRLILTDAAKWQRDVAAPDIVTCLGAEWIWHGMHGTIAALRDLVSVGGLVVYGGPRLHFDADPTTTTHTFGKLDTADDVAERLDECEFEIVHRIDPDEAGWLAYLDRGRRDVAEWARRYPGPGADGFVADQREWAESFERDRRLVGWSVWVARRRV